MIDARRFSYTDLFRTPFEHFLIRNLATFSRVQFGFQVHLSLLLLGHRGRVLHLLLHLTKGAAAGTFGKLVQYVGTFAIPQVRLDLSFSPFFGLWCRAQSTV